MHDATLTHCPWAPWVAVPMTKPLPAVLLKPAFETLSAKDDVVLDIVKRVPHRSSRPGTINSGAFLSMRQSPLRCMFLEEISFKPLSRS